MTSNDKKPLLSVLSTEVNAQFQRREECPERRSSFDLHDTIIPTRLEDLAVETRWPEDATDDLRVEVELVHNDRRFP